MTDRELLKLAANAAGIKLLERPEVHAHPAGLMTEHGIWSPLTDDGDALRLAVKLLLRVDVDKKNCVVTFAWKVVASEPTGIDPYAATRRAIVRAAAAIGEKMP